MYCWRRFTARPPSQEDAAEPLPSRTADATLAWRREARGRRGRGAPRMTARSRRASGGGPTGTRTGHHGIDVLQMPPDAVRSVHLTTTALGSVTILPSSVFNGAAGQPHFGK